MAIRSARARQQLDQPASAAQTALPVIELHQTELLRAAYLLTGEAARAVELAEAAYERREERYGAETIRMIERIWLLRVIDQLWIQHLTAIDDLREGIGLRAYGQRDPLVEYKREAHEMWEALLGAIHHDVVHTIFFVEPRVEPVRRPQHFVTNRNGEDGGRPKVRAGARIGRNEPCPCGSGRKYKRCHGR